MNDAVGVEPEADDPAVLALVPWFRAIVRDVFDGWRRSGSPFDPDQLADQTLARILPGLGATEASTRDAWRAGLAAMFIDLAQRESDQSPDAN